MRLFVYDFISERTGIHREPFESTGFEQGPGACFNQNRSNGPHQAIVNSGHVRNCGLRVVPDERI